MHGWAINTCADTEPWKLIKTSQERVQTVLNISLQITANLTVLMEPFLPSSAARLRTMLNTEPRTWAQATDTEALAAGHQINKAELLFDKIEDKTVDEQIEKLLGGTPAPRWAAFRWAAFRIRHAMKPLNNRKYRQPKPISCTKTLPK